MVVWEEPPGPREVSKPGVWGTRLAPFMERPGEWGRLEEMFPKGALAAATACNMRKGKYRLPEGMKPDELETTTRRSGDGTYLYIRWTPRDG